jgi:hypothetical protein
MQVKDRSLDVTFLGFNQTNTFGDFHSFFLGMIVDVL